MKEDTLLISKFRETMIKAADYIVKTKNIRHVFVVGETSIIPCIRKIIDEVFQNARMPDQWLPRFCTIARGCAKHSVKISQKSPEKLAQLEEDTQRLQLIYVYDEPSPLRRLCTMVSTDFEALEAEEKQDYNKL